MLDEVGGLVVGVGAEIRKCLQELNEKMASGNKNSKMGGYVE